MAFLTPLHPSVIFPPFLFRSCFLEVKRLVRAAYLHKHAKGKDRMGVESRLQTDVSILSILNFCGSLGAVLLVRSCAPVEF